MRIQRTSQVITVANLLSVAFAVPPLPQAVNAQPTNSFQQEKFENYFGWGINSDAT